MTTYFVTRHAGAREWAQRRGIEATPIEHLDIATLRPGDVVIGTLPADKIAELGRREARYVHLAIDLPAEARGRDLTADDMDRFGARLVEISARSTGPFPRSSTLAGRGHVRFHWRRLEGAFRQWLIKGRARTEWIVAAVLFVLIAVPGAFSTLLEMSWNRGGLALVIAAALVGALIYLAAFFVLGVISRTVTWSRLRTVPLQESRSRALLMGLSDLTAEETALLKDVKSAFPAEAAQYGLPVNEYLALAQIGDAGRLRKLAIKWQQNVRACHQHGEAVEAVLVLPSERSLAQWDEFRAFMNHFFPGISVDIVTGDDGKPFKLAGGPKRRDMDYEDYAYVWAGLSRAVDNLRESFAAAGSILADDEICIDVTAGTKTFSMAGANVTLNRDLRLSYVSNDGNLAVYNAEIDPIDALRRVMNAGGAGL